MSIIAADSGAGAAAILLIFFVGMFAVLIVGLVFWIIKLIEVIKLTDGQYQAAGTDKIVWVLVVALAGWIGALVWQLGGTRQRVLAAPAVQGWVGAPVQQQVAYGATPAGWYPDAANAAVLRWWDGQQWTEHRQPRAPG